jgi:hypothetical protein
MCGAQQTTLELRRSSARRRSAQLLQRAQRRCNERSAVATSATAGHRGARRCNARDGRAVVAAAVVRQHDGVVERGLEKAEVRCAITGAADGKKDGVTT